MTKANIRRFLTIAIALFTCLVIILLQMNVSPAENQKEQPLISSLPDISGLSWLEEDTFIAVHDAKNPKGNERSRVSLIKLPKSSEEVFWQPVTLNWPKPLGLSNDLESVSRIPNTSYFLVVESGDKKQFHRIFLIEHRKQQLTIASFIDWPVPIDNVEGTAVAKIGESLIFLYAERADSQPSTKIRWATLELHPLKIGTFQEVTFNNPELSKNNSRPVSAMEVDSLGGLYVASAFDPNNDNGPFRSNVWQIGKIEQDRNGKPQVILSKKPKHLARIDSLKVEGLTIREEADNEREIFLGTDDENYGGVLRPLR